LSEDIEALKLLLDRHMQRLDPKVDVSNIEERPSLLTNKSVISKSIYFYERRIVHKVYGIEIFLIIQHKAKLTLVFFSILAFYCNGNCGQVDRLYRLSALSALFYSKRDEHHENQAYIYNK
jgi:hypothetical protein